MKICAVTAAAASDVIESNKTTSDATMTSTDVIGDQDRDDYNVWTARMNEV